MDGLSGAASGIAVVSIALQLADGFLKLHSFWSSVNDAPQEARTILDDLFSLHRILEQIASNSSAIADATILMTEFEKGFRNGGKVKRKWTACKMVSKKEKLVAFRNSLEEAKSSLILAQLSNNM
ncbi:hypothetical protein K402DRAFT_399545 [Aulographum hederae CBS 113979]|uniref:Fungal N-terminal domain-containing protein n=1 Tax=Aulographum hederae CBS 113979 TaxID=1176131 RepID=A0A6G1HHC7_9PEZI|nr:hypothetical protein K402DRAFT_399545 [Aulographum hederae CBS 113979]